MSTDAEMQVLEQVIMAGLLKAETSVAPALRAQWAVAKVTKREFSGVGFFSHFAVPSTAAKVVPPNLELGDDFELEGFDEVVGVQLFVRDGVLSMLEGFTYTKP